MFTEQLESFTLTLPNDISLQTLTFNFQLHLILIHCTQMFCLIKCCQKKYNDIKAQHYLVGGKTSYGGIKKDTPIP